MTWMDIDFLVANNVEYLGMDVAPSVVSRNALRFSSYGPTVTFEQLDIVSSPLPPTRSGDLILCRHLMFHLPPDDNIKILEKLGESEADFVLMTSYLRADDNDREFIFAFGHEVNLFRRPYCVSDPKFMVKDYKFDMFLGVWERDNRQNGLGLIDKEVGCVA